MITRLYFIDCQVLVPYAVNDAIRVLTAEKSLIIDVVIDEPIISYYTLNDYVISSG